MRDFDILTDEELEILLMTIEAGVITMQVDAIADYVAVYLYKLMRVAKNAQ
jgi:hypothetical protein